MTALLKLLEDINGMFCHFRVNLSYSEVQDREMVNSDTNNHNTVIKKYCKPGLTLL